MTSRRCAITLLTIAVTSIGLLSACAPQSEPGPTPTAVFASEDEAFAAAEETYRAYNDALNEVDFQDLSSIEPLAELTTREYFAVERKAVTEFHANGIVRGGRAEIEWFSPALYEAGEKVTARACIDNRATTFVDATGTSIVPVGRPSHYASALTFVLQHGRLVLAESRAIEGAACPS